MPLNFLDPDEEGFSLGAGRRITENTIIKQYFEHSKNFDQGLGNIRPGQATVVVALDGSGDAESIQEGVDLLPPGGGVVYIKEGTYIISKPIQVYASNIALIGSGYATVIQGDGSAAMIDDTYIEVGDNISTFTAIQIKDIFIEGNQVGGTTTPEFGIEIRKVNDVFIIGCKFNKCQRCIQIDGIYTRITNNFVTATAGTTYLVVTASDYTLIGNNNIQSGGILLESEADFCTISGNIINLSAGDGIVIRNGASHNVVSANYISGAGNDAGIYIFNGSDYNSITGNVVRASPGDGILLDTNCDFNTINGNIVENNPKRGIYIQQNTCDKNIVTSNIILNNTTAQFTDNGTATVSANNVVA